MTGTSPLETITGRPRPQGVEASVDALRRQSSAASGVAAEAVGSLAEAQNAISLASAQLRLSPALGSGMLDAAKASTRLGAEVMALQDARRHIPSSSRVVKQALKPTRLAEAAASGAHVGGLASISQAPSRLGLAAIGKPPRLHLGVAALAKPWWSAPGVRSAMDLPNSHAANWLRSSPSFADYTSQFGPVGNRLTAAANGWGDVFGGVLREWQRSADSTAVRLQERARQALRAAVDARDAVLRGDHDAVRAFVHRWLRFEHPKRHHVEAASDALLSFDWDTHGDLAEGTDQSGFAVIRTLRLQTRQTSRNHRLLADTQIGGQRVDMLDRPIKTDGPYAGTLLDRTPARPEPDPLSWGFEDPRLDRVLRLMTDRERRVCLEKDCGQTWADAAVAAGETAEFGETVRRKRSRLVAEAARREASRLRLPPEGR